MTLIAVIILLDIGYSLTLFPFFKSIPLYIVFIAALFTTTLIFQIAGYWFVTDSLFVLLMIATGRLTDARNKRIHRQQTD